MPVTNRLAKTSSVNLIRHNLCPLNALILASAWLFLSPAIADDSEPSSQLSEPELLEPPLPEVLTTTRLRQPKSKVPGTTTIIEGDLIRDLGVMNLVEVFRLVPGMTVTEVGSNNPVTSYHGTVHYEQRRLQIQVDGRTSYRASLSDTDWHTMPVPLELIERIEVSRGPNSAAHGINAFLGTVNIITRSPDDTAGVQLGAASGSRGYLRTFGSVGSASEPYSWRLAYEKRRSDGFDRQVDGGQLYPFNDGYNMNTFSYDGIARLTDQLNLELRGGVVDGINEEDLRKNGKFGATDDPNIIVDDYYLQTRLNVTTSNTHFYHLQVSYQNYQRRQRWPICIPAPVLDNMIAGNPPDSDFDPGDCSPGDTPAPLVANLNEDIEESRLEFELQDTLYFRPDLKLVSGLGYRRDTFRSETFFNGRGNNYQSRAFVNAEYSPFEWVTLNAGGNWETTTTTDEGYFSPRVATNFIISENQAIRFVYSEAVRTPDAFEQTPDWSYRPSNVRAPYTALEGRRFRVEDLVDPTTSTFGQELEEERIVSREVSYFGQFYMSHALMSLELRYFNDELRDMISGVINEEDWFIANNVALDQEGFEVEGSLDYAHTKLRATYAYLDQDGWYTGQPDALNADDQDYVVELLGRLSVRHSGSFSWIQKLPFNLTSAATFYWADEFRRSQFERADFRIARRIDASRYSYELALTMQHYLNRDPELSPDNLISDHNQFFVEAGVRF
ncbi:TonB-dependent receptor plug domain-containing protein [Marinobacter sp.]|uniref:TonB-dependent receptor plug domain-containing protein n=1 Tax=Marinobacter sp. TaxID=50741 RepID=UPI0034A1780E